MVCCCSEKKKYAHKILVEESMNIIMEKLDILNIFRNLCSIESNYNNFNNNRNIIKFFCSRLINFIIFSMNN